MSENRNQGKRGAPFSGLDDEKLKTVPGVAEGERLQQAPPTST